jgi:hypothetical protein
MEVPQKNIELTLLGIYPKKCKSAHHRDICTYMFKAALFTKAKLWSQHRYPLVAEWIKPIYTQWNIHP